MFEGQVRQFAMVLLLELIHFLQLLGVLLAKLTLQIHDLLQELLLAMEETLLLLVEAPLSLQQLPTRFLSLVFALFCSVTSRRLESPSLGFCFLDLRVQAIERFFMQCRQSINLEIRPSNLGLLTLDFIAQCCSLLRGAL